MLNGVRVGGGVTGATVLGWGVTGTSFVIERDREIDRVSEGPRVRVRMLTDPVALLLLVTVGGVGMPWQLMLADTGTSHRV
jgi:hypothetical protein